MDIATASLRNMLKNSMMKKLKLNATKSKSVNHEDDAENTPPPPLCHHNIIQIDGHDRLSAKSVVTFDAAQVTRPESARESSDPSVKVVVRIRPARDDYERAVDPVVKKISSDSLSVEDRKFKFDSVFDSNSTQEEIFQLVGIPMVKDALAGYNASILSYGQTGTGKTYTMWGPPSAMADDSSLRSHQGVVPRFFQMLFSEIEKEQMNSDGKQMQYQCCCSFLEIYDERIGDLLNPAQRNLEVGKIKDGPINGSLSHVQNLTKEHVDSYEDITKILIKGLSNSKAGVMSTNSKSPRSHILLTFVIESWCKGISSSCFENSRSSRISFVDLAGLDSGQWDREGENAKKSLSQLGHVVNTLAKGTQPDKAEDSLYQGSSLTHLLRDSLGGNAKLTVVCAVSPDKKNNCEILSTLSFGQQVKFIRNDPVINKISEDNPNDLTDQICHLKDELIRAKYDEYNTADSKNGYFKGRNMRDSLNQLRVSLNRSLVLSNMDNDSQKCVNDDTEDIQELRQQFNNLHGYCEKSLEEVLTDNRHPTQLSAVEESCESEFMSEDEIDFSEKFEEIKLEELQSSSVLEEPVLSESPKFGNTLRKSMALASQSNFSKNSISNALRESLRQSEKKQSSLRSSEVVLPAPTKSLAASLQKGLQIIDYHQHNLAAKKTSVSFSFEHLALQSCPEADIANAYIQTLPEERPLDEFLAPVQCASCRRTMDNNSKDTDNTVMESTKVKELEKVCMEQAAKIKQLNHLVQQYKSEKSEHGQEIIPFEEFTSINKFSETVKEKCEIKDVHQVFGYGYDKKLPSDTYKSTDMLRSSLMSRSIQWQKSIDYRNASEEELEREREKWTEMESEWICLTDELRMDVETNRQRAESVEMELSLEKKCTEELDDALQRSVIGHTKMLEHYTELQEKYNDLVGKHNTIMEGIAEVKRAAAKAGKKGHGGKFAKFMAAELSASRIEKEMEREQLKKENKSLKVQLRDTAEAVHAAGELLVRLREAEESASAAEENFNTVQEENDKLKNQLEKVKRKHKNEMSTMKQYMAESKLPESALQPLYREDYWETIESSSLPYDDDQAWRAEFGAIYQDHYY
ncbi:hypothetical protein ACFE04_007465 [Oxalis oulophora]